MKTKFISIAIIKLFTGFLVIALILLGCNEDEPDTGSFGKLELNSGEMIVNTYFDIT